MLKVRASPETLPWLLWRQAGHRRPRLPIEMVLLQVDRDGLEHHLELVRAVGVGLGHESAACHTVCVVLGLDDDGHVLHLLYPCQASFGAALVDLRNAAHVASQLPLGTAAPLGLTAKCKNHVKMKRLLAVFTPPVVLRKKMLTCHDPCPMPAMAADVS